VTVRVTSVNDPPHAVDDSASTTEDTPIIIDVAANDSDVDSNLDPGSVLAAGGLSNGSLINHNDGTLTYSPDADFNGTDGFDYLICDDAGACDTATVTINVTSVNDPPLAVDDSASTTEDNPVVIDVAANDSDVDSNLDPGSVLAPGGPSNGNLINHNDGTLTYSPDADFNGTDGFDYLICDDAGACDTATVTVSVTPVNDAPVASGDAYTTNEDTPLTEPSPGVLSNDSDVDGDMLTAVLDTGPSNGSLVLSGDGSFSYTPNADYCDSDSFTYHANDGTDDSNVATVSIDVVCVDDPPQISVSIATQTVQYSDSITPVTITASDIDSASLSISDNAPSALLTSGSCTPDGSGGTSCTWTLAGQVLVSAATYDVTFNISDATTDVDKNTQVVVTPEDADVSFDSDNPVAVPVTGDGSDSSEPFSLLVHVQESSESGIGVLPGDINKADVSVTLEPVGPGSSVPVSCTSTGPVAAYDYSAVLEVSCSFSGVPVNTYTVEAEVSGGYYSGSGEDVLTVYDSSLGFTTGGGWFYWPGTSDRTNFGYTMKYNNKHRNVKGSLLLIRHLPDGSIYRVKSNAMGGLALGEGSGFGWATFSGKATYLEPGWPEPKGKYTFIVYVEDHGEPGKGADRFWIEIRDKNGNVVLVSSMSTPAASNAVFIEGGNIVVPHTPGK
jgi:hypothetical protein